MLYWLVGFFLICGVCGGGDYLRGGIFCVGKICGVLFMADFINEGANPKADRYRSEHAEKIGNEGSQKAAENVDKVNWIITVNRHTEIGFFKEDIYEDTKGYGAIDKYKRLWVIFKI